MMDITFDSSQVKDGANVSPPSSSLPASPTLNKDIKIDGDSSANNKGEDTTNTTTTTSPAASVSPLKRMTEIQNNKSTENLVMNAAATDSPPLLSTTPPSTSSSSDTASDIGGSPGGLTPRLSNPQLIHTSSLGMLPSRLSGVSAGAADRHLHRYRHYVEAKMVGNSVKVDPLAKHLILFPEDDVSIRETPQTHRTKEAINPTTSTTSSSSTTTTTSSSSTTLHQHIKMSLESFAEPRKTVIKNYSRYKKEAERLTHFDNDKYDIDIERVSPRLTPPMDLNASNYNEQADEIQGDLLKSYRGKDTDQENSVNRKKGRVGFFRYFRPDYNWGSGTEVSICNRVPHDIWTKQNYVSVLIELKGLVFMLGELEPFFCSLYLYDSVNKCRLSENFHFDFNSDQLRALLDKHSEKTDIITQSKHLIVSLPSRQLNDIWIMVRINKVMQGDPDLVKEPYVKLEEKDVKGIKKNKAKVSDVVTKFCERLGKYTQSFCFSAIPLTSENGDIKTGLIESDSLFKQVPKDNDDIIELIADLKDVNRKKKIKTIPGTLSLLISKSAIPPHTTRLDPSLDVVTNPEPLGNNNNNNTSSNNNNRFTPTAPVVLVNATSAPNLATLVQPSPSISVTPTITTTDTPTISIPVPTLNVPGEPPSSSLPTSTSLSSAVLSPSASSLSLGRSSTLNTIVPVIRELQCFPLKEDLIPYSDYINNLYIYPDTVNLSKASGRNICIKVEIRESDTVSRPPLSLIYGKSSCQKFTNQIYTDTQYHTKTPSYSDEIKVKLPTQLTSKYHILFSYYHVVCNKKKEKEESEQLIGYSFLPLYGEEKKLVDNGLHNLPVVLGMPKDGYLKNNDLDYLESGKNLFKFNLRLNTSIYPQNSYLNRFFLNSLDEKLSDNELNQILNDFIHIDAYESIKFFPIIIRQLIYVMCNRDATVGCNAIKAIFILLSKIQNYFEDSNVRIPFLVSFISHVFDCPKDTKIPVYSALCSRFVYFLMVKKYQNTKDNQSNNSPHTSSANVTTANFSGSSGGNSSLHNGNSGINQGNSASQDISNSTLFSFSWFIFDLIVKSLTLSSLDTLKGSRENKYDQDFIKYVPKLISFIIHHFQGAVTSSTDGRLALEANNSLALFVRDLFPVFDRGITVDLVFGYISEMNQGTSNMTNEANITTMTFFKFDFLKIVTDYEHYININIPLPYVISNIQTIKQKIIDMHPIAGLLISEVMESITSHQSEVRGVALNTLLTLLIKHEYDGRYQSADKRERIAAIYLPIILWFLDNFELFTNWYFMSGTEEKRLLISCILFVMKNLSKNLIKHWLLKEVPQRINTLFTMIDYCSNTFEYRPTRPISNHIASIPSFGNAPTFQNSAHSSIVSSSLGMPAPSSSSSSSVSQSSSTIPSMSILPEGGIPLSSISKLLKKSHNKEKDKGASLPYPPSSPYSDSPSSTPPLLTVASVGNMGNLIAPNGHPSSKSSLSLSKEVPRESISGGSSGNNTPPLPLPQNSSTGGSPANSSPTTRDRRESISQQQQQVPPSPAQFLMNALNNNSLSNISSATMDVPRTPLTRSPSISRSRPLSSNEPTLCAEANLIAIDFIEDFIETYSDQLSDPTSPVFEKLFSLIVSLLSKKQSHRVVHALLSTTRSFIHKFRNQFFSINNNYCGMICQQLLNLCNSPTLSVRVDAAGFFYSLLKHNHQEVNNIGRVKIQSTIALSKLASDNFVFGKVGARNLERSLATLVRYSRSEDTNSISESIIDQEKRSKLSAEQVKEVVDRFLQQIENMSTKLVKIIRDTMRVNQLKENSDPETIHELYNKIAIGYSDTPIIRIDWLDTLASLHVSQENYIEAAICKIRIAMLIHAYLDQHQLLPCRLDTSLIKLIVPELEEVVVEEDEGVCTSPIFSISGLISNIILAVNQLRMGEYYEFAILLYKLIIPLCEKTRDYASLSSYYKQSHKLYKEIIKSGENKSRMLGRYYRVGFYGKKFEDLDGKEFVYKEPKLTHLFSLAERLKTFYREKLGEPINIFPDSGRINQSSLDHDKLYLQITSVKPYFDKKAEEGPRDTYFERKTLLNKFVFITPFTLSGKTQGSITEQFHRKSIITIDCTAPNMLKRYPIIKYKEIEISPIENSIETIQQRCKLLSLEIHCDPVNIKTLQGVLQGSVLLQVNAGALEICRGFLSKSLRGNWDSGHVEKLAENCREFLALCRRALDLNKCNIQMNQIGFHYELEQGYRRLNFKMEKYINGEINESDESELDQALQDDADDDSSQLTITDEMYADNDSSKDSASIIESLTPSSLIQNFIKDPKKRSGLLTVRDNKPKRESKEYTLGSGESSIFNNPNLNSGSGGKALETPRSSSKRDSKGEP